MSTYRIDVTQKSDGKSVTLNLVNLFGEEDCAEHLFFMRDAQGNRFIVGADSKEEAYDILDRQVEKNTTHLIDSVCCDVSVTYEDVDDESASRGDVKDHGFLLINNERISVKKNGPMNRVSSRITPEEMLNLALKYGTTTDGSGNMSWLSSGENIDYTTGVHTIYSLHLNEIHFDQFSVDVRDIVRCLHDQVNCPRAADDHGCAPSL